MAVKARNLPPLCHALVVRHDGRGTTALARDGGALVRELVERGVSLDGLEVVQASLEEAFVQLVAEAD